MALTNFPQGVSSFGMPLLGAGGIPATTGRVYFVNSATGQNNNNRGDAPDNAYASLAYAATKVRASKGDIIILMPGHTENVASAGAITLSTAGVRVFGLKSGAAWPIISFTTATTATVAISGAGTVVENVMFVYTAVDAIATGINITTSNVQFRNCRFLMADSTNQAAVAVTLGANSSFPRFTNCEFWAPNAGATAAITGAVAINNPWIEDCDFDGNFSTAAINNATNAWTGLRVLRSRFNILGTGKAVVAVAGTTGVIAHNFIQIAANIAAGGSMTAAGALKVENYAQETAGIAASGVVDPAAVAIT